MSFNITPVASGYQEIHPCSAINIYSVKINTSLIMMKECWIPASQYWWKFFSSNTMMIRKWWCSPKTEASQLSSWRTYFPIFFSSSQGRKLLIWNKWISVYLCWTSHMTGLYIVVKLLSYFQLLPVLRIRREYAGTSSLHLPHCIPCSSQLPHHCLHCRWPRHQRPPDLTDFIYFIVCVHQ